jgi:hypothetical protein
MSPTPGSGGDEEGEGDGLEAAVLLCGVCMIGFFSVALPLLPPSVALEPCVKRARADDLR